jgi:hypothetical protein
VSLSGGAILKVIPEDIAGVSPSGKEFARAAIPGVTLFQGQVPSDRVTLGVDSQHSSLPVFSRNGRFLAWGTTSGQVMLADLAQVRKRLASLGRR